MVEPTAASTNIAAASAGPGRMRPIAMGMLVDPTDMAPSAFGTAGASEPSAMPSAIAAKIHRVR